MKIFVQTLISFTAALVLQFLIWKIRLPKNHTRAILVIFFCCLMAGVSFGGPFSPYGRLRFVLLFVSLTLAYVVTYSGTEVDSPSLVMVMRIAKAGRIGLAKDAFYEEMSNDVLVMPRLKDLLAGGLVRRGDGDRYRLTGKGAFVARLFEFYRELLARPRKGG